MDNDPLNVDITRLLLALGVTDFRERNGEIWAPCPYPGHPEKEPSWSIKLEPGNPLRHGYNFCFGCKQSGGPVHLVRERIGLSTYSAAIDWIKERKLDLDSTPPLRANLKITRPRFGAFPHPKGAPQTPYAQWNSVAKKYVEKRGITVDQVERWGLCVGKYGPTRQRIVFPIFDSNGILLNWTGRAYAGQDKGSNPEPRYRHPRDEENADRSAIFGEEFWNDRPSRDMLVLCEGAINALACERAGARYIGALSGSAFDKGQVLKLAAFGRVLIATDVDKAGDQIAGSLMAALSGWKRVRRMPLPEGKDPADIATKDMPALRKLIQWDNAA
jgi:DNA primase